MRATRLVTTMTAAVLLAAGLGACAGERDVTLPESPPASSDGAADGEAPTGTWALGEATIDGTLAVLRPDAPVTLEIVERDGDTVIGGRICNAWGTEVTAWPDLDLSQAAWTEMACEDARMSAEEILQPAIWRVTSAEADGEDLVLTGEGVELRFVPPHDVPAGADELQGQS